MKPQSLIEAMIDAACGYDPNAPQLPVKLTDKEKEMCTHLGRDVLSDLRHNYLNQENTPTPPQPTSSSSLSAACSARLLMAAKGVLSMSGMKHEDGHYTLAETGHFQSLKMAVAKFEKQNAEEWRDDDKRPTI
jgi:hypothetical protein